MNILGISAYYHDSASALLRDGELAAAAQEERFSRRKHDSRFPELAIRWCLASQNLELSQLDAVLFYEKPWLKFERLLETYFADSFGGIRSFLTAMPIWIKQRLNLRADLQKRLTAATGVAISKMPPILFAEHHQSHAAAAFFPSSFRRAAVLCMDGVGEWATTSLWLGENNDLSPLWQIDFPHSLGLLYSAFTYYAGFKVNSGEYKLMGLAPYGEPRYCNLILDNLLDLKPDGTFRLNMAYFNYLTGFTMTNHAFDALFGGPPRQPEAPLTQRVMDIAASIQAVTDEVVLRLARTAASETGADCLCLGGGVALNCVANGRLAKQRVFRDLWVQPAPGDAGGAIGAALVGWHVLHGNARAARESDSMRGALLGPSFSQHAIEQALDEAGATYERLDPGDTVPRVAKLLAEGAVVGWFQGAMEFGPRALGNRSILADPRRSEMQSKMNLKIKFRESFRPFAPSVLAEKVDNYFDLEQPSPYMTLVAPVRDSLRVASEPEQAGLKGLDRLRLMRSTIPAVTHVDYSARIQTVSSATNPRFHALISEFERITGCAVLVNTSFNVRGEPIVCTPRDAYRCFMDTGMDYLAIGDSLLSKAAQPATRSHAERARTFELD